MGKRAEQSVAGEVDVRPHLEDLSSDVISRAAFGCSYEQSKRIFLVQKEQIGLFFRIMQFTFIPGWRNFDGKNSSQQISSWETYAFLPELCKLLMLLIHRGQEMWGDDAKEFELERLSEGVSKVTKNVLCFSSFSWDPRTCIGLNFVLLEAKVFLALVSMILFQVLRLHTPGYMTTRNSSQDNPVGRFFEGVSKAGKNKLCGFPLCGGTRTLHWPNYALREAKVLPALVLQKFSIQPSPSHKDAPSRLLASLMFVLIGCTSLFLIFGQSSFGDIFVPVTSFRFTELNTLDKQIDSKGYQT
ncbi:cytochrome P450 CYP72A219-like [Eucalyptus grandis]|uniref:cytochrome P450 CYP72A219-like n=1 Tax=Eucalyptus grandis TaxID=71139 RepID=UPI00192E9084|nr:cytochrome P450 CYP72A219-like [Eucalyptus grandis]